MMLHFIWLGPAALPDDYAENIDRFRFFNPCDEIILHESDDMLHPDYREVFDATPHMEQKSDYLRYSILEAVGGVYLDTDFFPVREMPVMPQDDRLAMVIAPRGWNAVLSCAPSAPIFQHVRARFDLSRVEDRLYGTSILMEAADDDLVQPLPYVHWTAGYSDQGNYYHAKAGDLSVVPANQIAIHKG